MGKVVIRSIQTDLRNKHTDPRQTVQLTLFMPLWLRDALKRYAMKQQTNMTDVLVGEALRIVASAGEEEGDRYQLDESADEK